MSISRLTDLVLWYGTPALFVAGMFLGWLFLYLDKTYKTREEAASKLGRDHKIMLFAVRFLFIAEFMLIVLLLRSC